MPSITVSKVVFERIWSLKEPGEESENDILKRVLGSDTSDVDSRLRDYEKADQDIQSTN
jgi:predicted CopG family antitoxin